MKTSVAPSDQRTQQDHLRSRLDDVRPHSVKAPIDPNASVYDREILDLIRRTMERVSLSQKAMAIAGRCAESELSEALNAKPGRRFDAVWLWRQDNVFLRTFLELLAEKRGLTPQTALAEEVALLTALFGRLVALLVARAA